MDVKDNLSLLSRIKNGDDAALEELIKANFGLIKKTALRFLSRGVEYDDLFQIASIGMIRAARDFDFSYGTSFSTYAVPLMIGEIRKYLRDDGLIKVSRNIKSNGIRAMREKEKFENEHKREPTLRELSELCELGEEELVECLDALTPALSLDSPVYDDGASTLGSMVSEKESEVDKLTERIALGESLRRLTVEQRRLLYLRYSKDLSQQKTGELLGKSQVKISREEKKIIEILKKAL